LGISGSAVFLHCRFYDTKRFGEVGKTVMVYEGRKEKIEWYNI
jgi:hypothetical protein